ncbi:MAG: transcription antitermination factor NusB [Firmicutes bacterium]|nr:transcription antitermination factor NusB [Bacillota bacterium]
MDNNSRPRMESRRAARNHVFNIIFQCEFSGVDEIEDTLKNYYEVLRDEVEEEKKDDPEYEELVINEEFVNKAVFGISENIEDIDRIIGENTKGWKVERLAKVDLAILRIAVYEMKYDDDIPNQVAINEAVEMAKKYGEKKSSSFINGILGAINRKIDGGVI